MNLVLEDAELFDLMVRLSDVCNYLGISFDTFALLCVAVWFLGLFLIFIAFSVFFDIAFFLYEKALKPLFLWQFRKLKARLDCSDSE